VLIRTFVDANRPEDIKAALAVQDAVTITQASPGSCVPVDCPAVFLAWMPQPIFLLELSQRCASNSERYQHLNEFMLSLLGHCQNCKSASDKMQGDMRRDTQRRDTQRRDALSRIASSNARASSRTPGSIRSSGIDA
jgi:hypothetical protein